LFLEFPYHARTSDLPLSTYTGLICEDEKTGSGNIATDLSRKV